MRLALTLRPAVLGQGGERRDTLDQRWISLLRSYGYSVYCVPNTAFEDFAELSTELDSLDIAGVILTGGNDPSPWLFERYSGKSNGAIDRLIDCAPERDRTETWLIEWASSNKTPLLGVCRGMQVLNLYYGGGSAEISGHAGTEHVLTLHQREASPQDFDLWRPLDKMVVQSFHRLGFEESAICDNAYTTLLGPDGTVEAFKVRSLPQFGVMWHPERENSASYCSTFIKDIFK